MDLITIGGILAYYALVFAILGAPLAAMFGKTGLNSSWVLLLLIPVAGIWLSFMLLAFARWPAQS